MLSYTEYVAWAQEYNLPDYLANKVMLHTHLSGVYVIIRGASTSKKEIDYIKDMRRRFFGDRTLSSISNRYYILFNKIIEDYRKEKVNTILHV